MLPIEIPLVAHCFWYGPYGLPYLRYLSIASFAIHNPNINLDIYTTNDLRTGRAFDTHEQSVVHITKDFFSAIQALPNVAIKKVPDEFLSIIPFKMHTAVHVSDILRVWLLSTVGGYWMDSDIIFTSSLDNSFISLPENNKVNTIIAQTSFGSICPYQTHRIGFLAASKKNNFFDDILQKILVSDQDSDYQAYGSLLYNATYSEFNQIYNQHPQIKILNLPNHVLYSMHLTELLSDRISTRNFINNSHILGCHWYGGGDQLTELVEVLNCADDVERLLEDLYVKEPNFLLELFSYACKLKSVIF